MRLLILIILITVLSCKKTGVNHDTPDLPADEKSAACVKQIFDRDSVLGGIRNHASETMSLSQAILDYTKELESLDFSECPEKFTSAFNEHVTAWKKITELTDKHLELRGELHDIFTELEKSEDSTEFKNLLKQVWDTWYQVEESTQQRN